MYKPVLSFAMITASLLLNAYAVDMQEALNGKEIRRLVSGNTVEGYFTRKREDKDYLTSLIKFKDYFGENGEIVENSTAAGLGGRSNNISDHGSWTTKKGRLCVQFKDARDTRKKCRKVIPMGEGKYGLYSEKGKLKRTWDRVVPGNPHKLK